MDSNDKSVTHFGKYPKNSKVCWKIPDFRPGVSLLFIHSALAKLFKKGMCHGKYGDRSKRGFTIF